MVQYTAQQLAALDNARRWLDDPNGAPVFRLFGFAGTGKSTIAHEVNAHVGGRALSCAYTWKAASVMSRKGLAGASSIHSLIYTPTGNDTKHLDELKEELRLLEAVKEPSRGLTMRLEAVRRAVQEATAKAGKPSFILKESTEVRAAPLIILDECSMPDIRTGEDLVSFGTKILALGDPGQLPPIKGAGYFTQVKPDVLLTEVHRNCGPILRLATDVREGRALRLGNVEAHDGEVSKARVVERIGAATALAADQILCGTNARRQSINARHRQLDGHDKKSPMPVAGEKLVCLHNDRDLGLYNSTQWVTTEDSIWEPGEDDVYLRIRPDTGGADMGVPAEAGIFIDEALKSNWPSAQQFTWGSAMTTHKAQGSEWSNVIVFDDWHRADSRRQWLYTAATRASDDLTIVQV